MKAIPLTNGKGVALVDDEDYELVAGHSWCLHGSGYACSGKNGRLLMHRLILGLEPGDGQHSDHLNRNKLDNRRCNLRVATPKQNARNSGKKHKHTSSRFKGVRWHRAARKWMAEIGVNYRRVYLGLYEDERDAALAYDEAAVRYFGEFANLNFPNMEECGAAR